MTGKLKEELKSELLEQLLDNSNQMIQVSDLKTNRMLFANKMAQEYSVNAGQPYEGRYCYEYMKGLDEPCSFCPINHIGDKGVFETEVDNGNEVYAVRTAKIKWNGKDAFIEYAWDLSSVKRAQKLYEEQVKTILSSIPEAPGIFYLDITNDSILSLNGSSEAVAYMNGLKTVDDVVAWTASFIPDETLHEPFFKMFCRDAIIKAHEVGTTQLEKDTLSYFGDGSIRPARVICRILVNPANFHLEAIIYGLDISIETEEKEKHEKEIEEQLAIFNVVARNFKNIYLINFENDTAKILQFKDEHIASRLREWLGKEIPYKHVLCEWVDDCVHPDDQEMVKKALSSENLKQVLSEKSEYIGNFRMLINGKVIYYQYNVSEMSKPGYAILGFQNIDAIVQEQIANEQKQRELDERYKKELLESKEEAERANHSKTEFLKRMSHDIRTPLNGIQGMLNIADRYSNDMEKQAECREKVREASNLLLELINEVLDMSKMESGKIVLEHVSFDFVSLSKEVYEIMEKQAFERNIEIVQLDCGVTDRKLLGSPTHIKRILMNILSNAIKYNVDGGKIYITCKEIENDGDKVKIEFKCRDTGIGMSEEYQKHIFEPFTREHESANSRYKGTGLGMPITKAIVEEMGGSIDFESLKGEGTTFDIIFALELDKSVNVQKNDEIEEEYSIKGKLVLLAEDNELNMEILSFLLQEEGADVIQAWNGEEAIEAFENSIPGSIDVILMDVMMPLMNGHEATKKIRELDRDDAKKVPIIAMTANAFAEDKIAARKAGMNEHVSKPIDMKELVKVIAKLTGVSG